MFDIQHDSPVPIHEQLMGQIRAQVASGSLAAGAKLSEYRAFAQELLTNPQVVARAYGDLEWEGVLIKTPTGQMEVTAAGARICLIRLQETARKSITQAVAQGLLVGLTETEVLHTVEAELAAAKVPPVSAEAARKAIKKPTHERSHRDSQGIQDLSRQSRPGPT